MGNYQDLTGRRFGQLVVIRQASTDNKSHRRWECVCDCGQNKICLGYNLLGGGTTSCGHYRKDHCRTIAKISAAKRVSPDTSLNKLLSEYKTGAKNRGYDFLLTSTQFKELASKNCYYCGNLPTLERVTIYGKYVYNGIDRIDNSIGYSMENCVSCCFDCNRAKGTMTQGDFFTWIMRVYTVHNNESKTIYTDPK